MKKYFLKHQLTFLSELTLFSLLLLFIAGCTPQKVTSQVDTSPNLPKQERPAEVPAEPKKPDLPIGPDTFDIGLILPFYLDSVRPIPDSVEVSYYKQSTLAIEFYNGVKMALDKLTPAGLHVRLHVYDDMNDKERIKKIAQLPLFKNLDLLLGPVYNNNLRLMAEFAKRDSVLMVSPLSPAMDITTGNPYFVMVNPSIEVHCKRLFDYAVQKHRRDNIVLLTHPGSAAEEQYAAIFRKLLKEYQKETNDTVFKWVEAPFTPTSEGDDLEKLDTTLAKFFIEYKKNVVIIPSMDKAYNHSVARKLFSFVQPPAEIEDAPQFDIKVLGLPAWSDQRELRLDYAQKLNVHFTSSSFIPPSFYSPQESFYISYVNAFHSEPSEYAVKGYDLMLFFGNLLVKNGAQKDSMLLVEKYNGIHTKFRFGIHSAETSTVAPIDTIPVVPVTDYIENKYVHLLKYEDNEVREVE